MKALAWFLFLLLAAPVSAQSISVDGVTIAIWGDPASRAERPRIFWVHRDDSGVERSIVIPRAVLESAGGYFRVNGQRTTISAVARSAAGRPGVTWDVRSIRVRTPANVAASGPAGAPQLGAKPYAVLLCKFPDVDLEPTNVATLTAVQSGVYPGMDHYWREVSANQMNIAGTRVFGWFTLPQPKAAYMLDASTPRHSDLAAACAAAADPTVDFSQFFGIQAQFNANFTTDGNPGSAYGGQNFLALDGASRAWPFTWMPHWATQNSLYGVFAHEMGHSLGLPHSSGPYTQTYDSKWDIMSNSYIGGFGNYAVGGHTIAAHKNELGWIPAQRRRVVTTDQTFTLEQLEFPPAGSNPLMAEVGIPGTSARYVIEARLLLGYDQFLPGEGVIIHRLAAGCVINTGSPCATVVDDDGNGNPNDAGAMWRAGETFVGEGGVRVTINSRTQDGWNITVNPNVTVSQCGLVLNQTTGGTISVTAGTLTGACGRSVTVTAAPAAGYVFSAWSNGSTSASQTLTITQTTTLSAVFVRQCSLTLVQTTGGSTALTAGALAGDCGRTATVTGTASPGYLFRTWSTGNTTNPYTFSIEQDLSISATYAQQCALSLVQTAGGSVAVTQGSLTGDCGRSLSVGATPAAGYIFLEWTDGVSGSPRTLAVTQVAQVVSATFTELNGLAGRLAGVLLGNAAMSLTPAESKYLDTNGNSNGSADLGDFLALLDHFPGVQVNATLLKAVMERGTTAPDSTTGKKR
jgi:M6 family metalloprotease-like protein